MNHTNKRKSAIGSGYIQLNCFVPIDHITRDREGIDIDDIDIATFRSNIEPFALER